MGPGQFSWAAGGTIAPCRFVGADRSGEEQVLQASVLGQPTFGVMQEEMRDAPGLTGSDAAIAAIANDTGFKVHPWGSPCLVEAGGTFNFGDDLMSDTSGKAILATSGYYVSARALQNGVSGRKVYVLPVQYQKSVLGNSNQ